MHDRKAHAARPSRPSTASKFSRPQASFAIVFIGAPLGAVLGSVGYLGIVTILESAFVPPLKSPENYWQFGFLAIHLGFFGLIYGASFGLIPYTRFLLWLPVFLLISLFVVSGGVATHFDAAEVTWTAMLLIGAVIVVMAAMTSAIAGKIEGRAQSLPGM